MSDVEIKCAKVYLNTLGEISIFCVICNSKLDNSNNLASHIETHFSTIPYECYLCDDFYLEFGKLVFHIKNEHSALNHNYEQDIHQNKITVDAPQAVTPSAALIESYTSQSLPKDLDAKLEENKAPIIYVNEQESQKYEFFYICKEKSRKNNDLIKNAIITNDGNTDLNNGDINIDEQLINDHSSVDQINNDLITNNDFQNNVDYDRNCDDQQIHLNDTSNENVSKRKEGKFMCDLCGKCYTQLRTLEQHLQSHLDPSEREWACSICDKKYMSLGYLKVHLRYHNNERPYKCEYCPRRFITNSMLWVHLRDHLNIRPYTCDVCGKKFKISKSLKEHIRTHTGEKPFPCDLCNLRFARRQALQYHRRIHTGEKPYKCKMCLKGFPSNAGLYGHMKSNHKTI